MLCTGWRPVVALFFYLADIFCLVILYFDQINTGSVSGGGKQQQARVSAGILLIHLLNRLLHVSVTDSQTRSLKSIKLRR